MTSPTREGLSPGYEAILMERVPVELFDRVISGITRENKAGFAFFPSDADLLFSVNYFFESAEKGNEELQKQAEKFKENIILPVFDFSNINNTLRLKRCLDALKIQKERLPDIEMGFRGILAKDPEASRKQVNLAKRFTKFLEINQ
jgi:hypothetical protein